MSLPVSEDLLPPYLQHSNKVIYSDGCIHGSLYWLNFCQYCKKICDQKGMVYDVEMQRCTTCAETFTIMENNEKEKGCPQCFLCPSCGQALVIRTTILPSSATTPPKEGEDKATQEKRFYLVCQTCRWSTRSAGIQDVTRLPSVTSPWNFISEGSTNSKDEIGILSDYYRALTLFNAKTSINSTSSKENKKSKRHIKLPGYSSLIPDKYKLVSVAQKRLAAGGMGNVPSQDLVDLESKLPKIIYLESESLEEVEEDILKFVSSAEIEKRLPFHQRLLFPGEQPVTTTGLIPRNKPLASKATWRCRTCQHVMLKMDYAAQSIKYKLVSSAPLLIPTIQPCNPKLILGKPNDFIVSISNPLSHDVHMTFSPTKPDESIPDWVTGVLVNDVKLPGGTVVLLNRACAADEKGGGGGTDSLAGEDSSVIAFRRLYIVGLRFSCVPMSVDVDNWVSFHVNYDFQETQATVFNAEKQSEIISGDTAREAATTWIQFRIDMNLGRSVSQS